ncbi:hypothetical protein DID98_05420 [Burkholderia sp. Bp8984]|nr:hypothetical protein DID98_05420 [Burkholderia sp. Bp8984]
MVHEPAAAAAVAPAVRAGAPNYLTGSFREAGPVHGAHAGSWALIRDATIGESQSALRHAARSGGAINQTNRRPSNASPPRLIEDVDVTASGPGDHEDKRA